ncbi:MAG: energy-coupling factor transporter ATPase [Epulopiscium sp.]|nr:energy-coupling factor transporter ATPase [Candidatus Epulonipiscium sp.]
MSTETKAIELKEVYHLYSSGTPFEKEALKNVNISVSKGEFIGIIGHTGSGKSTLIQHFNGLLKPTSGTVLVNGQDIHSEKANKRSIRQKVGLVFQYPEHQLFEMTIFKDVAFGPKNMGLSEEEVKKRVEESLRIVGIGPDMYEKSPFELSGGQKRRVAIAGVLAMQPEVLILDEPTAGLDPRGRDEILAEIQNLHQTLGITIILVSHSMEDIARFVHRLIVMHRGTVAFDDVPKEVFLHVEELESMGLAVPQITYVMHQLKARGFDVPLDVLTLDEAVKVIRSQLGMQK